MVVHILTESSDPVDTGGPPAVVGFVVGRGIGNAVTRNRVKRRLRHAVADRIERLPGMMVVVRANPAAARVDFPRMCADLDRCLSRVAAAR